MFLLATVTSALSGIPFEGPHFVMSYLTHLEEPLFEYQTNGKNDAQNLRVNLEKFKVA